MPRPSLWRLSRLPLGSRSLNRGFVLLQGQPGVLLLKGHQRLGKLAGQVPWDIVLLALLPIVLVACLPDHFISPFSIDAWLYFGYYLNLPEYLRTFDGLYYTTRLSTILPGWLAYQLFPPLIANYVLHVGLYYVSVGSLFLTLKETVNRRAAFISALALGCHFHFFTAIGWDYVDGFGIAYFLFSAWMLTAASRSRFPRTCLLAAGAGALAMGVANITYFLLVPLLLGHYLVLNWHRRGLYLLSGTVWFVFGAGGLFALLGTINWSIAGRFWFLLPSFAWTYSFMREAAPSPWQVPLAEWIFHASWLVFPCVAACGGILALLRSRFAGSRPLSGIALYYQLQLLVTMAGFAVANMQGRVCMLQFLHYASLLMPLVFLALGGQLAQWTEPRRGPIEKVLVLTCALCFPVSLLLPSVPLLSVPWQLLPAICAGWARSHG